MGKRRLIFLLLTYLASCSLAANATPLWQRQQFPEKPGWERPPPRADWQQHLQRWRQLPPQRRARILNRAQRFQKLPPAAKRRLWEEYQRSHMHQHTR